MKSCTNDALSQLVLYRYGFIQFIQSAAGQRSAARPLCLFLLFFGHAVTLQDAVWGMFVGFGFFLRLCNPVVIRRLRPYAVAVIVCNLYL